MKNLKIVSLLCLVLFHYGCASTASIVVGNVVGQSMKKKKEKEESDKLIARGVGVVYLKVVPQNGCKKMERIEKYIRKINGVLPRKLGTMKGHCADKEGNAIANIIYIDGTWARALKGEADIYKCDIDKLDSSYIH